MDRGGSLHECPYCGSDLNGPAHRHTSRTDALPGAKSTGAELVYCADCGGTIDGFSSH